MIPEPSWFSGEPEENEPYDLRGWPPKSLRKRKGKEPERNCYNCDYWDEEESVCQHPALADTGESGGTLTLLGCTYWRERDGVEGTLYEEGG